MKFICNGLDMFDAVSKVSKAVSFKDKSSILSGIRIEAKEDKIVFFATDGEISIEKKIEGEVFKEGEIIVPAKYLIDLIKKLDKQEVSITLTQKNEIKITYGDSEAFLQLFDLQKFPKFELKEEKESFEIKGADFCELVYSSHFCAATDDTRPIFKGILLELRQDKIKAVALDGFRLAIVEKSCVGRAEKSLIVPAKSLVEIARFVKPADGLEIYFDANNIMIKIDGAKIISRLYSGEFLKYENIMPKTSELGVVIQAKMFSEGLERVAVLLENLNSKMVKFEFASNNLTMLCNSEIGSIKEKIPCNMSGGDLTIAFNARFFADLIKNVPDEFVRLSFNNAQSPCLVTAAEEKGVYKYMILPIRAL